MAPTFVAYCEKCKCETKHSLLKQTSFLHQCVIAAVSGFTVDLREPRYQCLKCGIKN